MEIKRLGKKAIELDSQYAKVVGFGKELAAKDLAAIKPEIVLEGELSGAFNVNSPGEYEKNEVWLMAMQNAIRTDTKVDIYVLTLDNIRVAIIDNAKLDLSKKQIEKIGIIDILVADLTNDLTQLADLVGEVDPQILIPINENSTALEEFIKKLGVKPPEANKKLKFKVEDFENEEYQLEVKVLTI
jgi:hypothetical protein